MNEAKPNNNFTNKSDGAIEKTWSFFISLKLTLFLLIALTLLSILGTFLLQDKTLPELLAVYPRWLVSTFSLLGFFNIYRSTIFIFFEILLALNITACSIERFPKSFKRARRNDRFNWQPMGVYLIHFSLIIIFAGALVKQFFGFEGFINLPEGETADYFMQNTGGGVYKKVPMPFTVSLAEFSFEQFDKGQPKDFKSRLIIKKNGVEQAKKTIEVNDPLEYDGILFYQSSFYEDAPEIKTALEFRDTETDTLLYSVSAGPGDSIKPPGMDERFVLGEFTENKMGLGPALRLAAVKSGAEPSEFMLFHKFPGFDKKNRKAGVYAVLKKYEVKRRYISGIEVGKDPGAPIVLFGSIVMMLGLFISLYLKREKQGKQTSADSLKQKS